MVRSSLKPKENADSVGGVAGLPKNLAIEENDRIATQDW
jgi:hypothetical protein